jgi:IS5 family transposase
MGFRALGRGMRQRFETQFTLGNIPIENVVIPRTSRDELPPLLTGLQFIFKNVELRTRVFDLLEAHIMGAKPTARGRPGMQLWHILVLGVLRVGLDCDFDRIGHIANFDLLVRRILGVSPMADLTGAADPHAFHHRTISDNIGVIDEALLEKINALVVEYGLPVLKKNAAASLEIKTDSFVLESNIHYPTDANLLWDSTRKGIGICFRLSEALALPGWRKAGDWMKRCKGAMRSFSKAAGGGGAHKQERVKELATAYLAVSREVQAKVMDTLSALDSAVLSPAQTSRLMQLKTYSDYAAKFMDQLRRRVLQGEEIPHAEKMFSIFETHVELIKKGKLRPPVEFGHRILVSTERHGFIVDYKVTGPGHEGAQALPAACRLASRFGADSILSLSFDKGFSSLANDVELKKILPASMIILPKKGRRTAAETERESDPKWKQRRDRHSAVESDINSLEHHGLGRCRDKGERAFGRYTGLGVLAYNLNKIGTAIQKAEKEQAAKKAAKGKTPGWAVKKAA